MSREYEGNGLIPLVAHKDKRIGGGQEYASATPNIHYS